ncbi:DUF6252 family protein [Pedobacter heparinus]|uniref:DUF6252 family protein n=1 Tax=Pedobacter heparinus TaxID=984 RepID=UPI00292F3FC3|nr:DUF6252 family protein [Pedobacter heparinus]
MKIQIKSIVVCTCCLLLITASCKKAKTGIDGLPAATQEGKNTIGCMVNGVLFKPKGSATGGPIVQSYYQLDNGNYLFLVAARRRGNNRTLGVQIETLGIELQTGMTIPLVERSMGKARGWYIDYGGGEFKDYQTNPQIKGELKITRFDLTNQIVSGTFWFDAVDDKGLKVEVREGRFDMNFAR